MKVLIVSQYFYPENFKVNDIAFDFKKKGYDVTVLTGKPNYPSGKFSEGYSFFKKKYEEIDGVKVYRTPLFPRLNGSGKYLALNYLSFLFFSFFTIHFRLKGNYDVVFSHHPSPLTSALPAIWCAKKFNAPYINWVLDLWPDSVSANSNIKGGFIYNSLKKVVSYIYKNSDLILVSSKMFKTSILQNFDIKPSKLAYFPNWAEDVFINKNNLEDNNITLPEGFNVMFAGNLGESQDFESVLKAASLTKQYNINWILLGDGRKSDWIKQQIKEDNLERVHMLGRHALKTMPSFFKKADAMLVSLKDEPTFALTVPAKVQAYMASKKIILGMLNGEGKDLINESESGIAVNAGDFQSLANSVIKISNLPEEKIYQIEGNSFNYYLNNFSKDLLFDKLEAYLKNTTNG
ncbi:glycosyltransferase family 4 protein [Olleya namhaensis]|uniref:glycosyltransferase family 4 protein n=1 Tax=Olleya namhaensis TaxID=1144750 RepID=UPI002330C324|nr:glycosyltransferase family 4 protein [Olleya namhaensis]